MCLSVLSHLNFQVNYATAKGCNSCNTCNATAKGEFLRLNVLRIVKVGQHD